MKKTVDQLTNDVSVSDINVALNKVAQDARRWDKAIGLDMVYVKDNTLVKESANGEISVLKELQHSSNHSKRIRFPQRLEIAHSK